jgi:hypothetical protein
MGLRVTGLESVQAMLVNDAERSGRGARNALERGAKAIQKRAKSYAPVDEGNLEDAIDIQVIPGDRGRYGYLVYVDPDHAAKYGKVVGDYYERVHEDFYTLGPRSAEKQRETGYVGRKYLEKAFLELEPDIERDVEENIAVGIGH